MYKKLTLSSLFFFCFYLQNYAQLCEGSLGDPVVEINFGSGTSKGGALDSSITAFTYSSGELDEGEYTIANTTSGLKSNAWHVTSDHTGNTNGYMMVINSAVLADEGVFYTKTVTGLCANTTYEFSAWLINIMNPAIGTDQYHPDVTFRISDSSGNILGSNNTGDISQTSSGTWLQYGLFFTLEDETEVIITILNIAPSAHPGNDIALDDIAFKPCGPTISNTIDNQDTSNLSVCQNENVSSTFQASVSSGYSDPRYQWQSSDNNGLTWNDISGETTPNYIFTDTSIAGDFLYRLTVANGNNINTSSCRITSDNFNIEIIETPEALTGEPEQVFCTTEAAKIADIQVNSTAIWYDSLTEGNILANTNSLVDGTTYYAAKETISGCESDDRIVVLVSIIAPSLVINNISTEICDNLNDSQETIDLTIYESEITDCSDCVFTYFTSQSNAENDDEGKISVPTSFNWSLETPIIYTRIDSADNCYQIAQIEISLQDSPIITISDFVGICENDNNITIDAGDGFDSYLWSTGDTSQTITLTIEDTGNYTVTVTQDHNTYSCSSTKEFEIVLSNTAVISNIDIDDWTDSNNMITVNLSELSLGDYEYSIDNITFQDSNTFTALTAGEYIIYVRDKNGCGTTQEQVYLLNSPKYFTPNNDGYHDTWSIKYSETEPNLTVKIYDRYGKLLKNLGSTSSWDGTYSGQNMPTSDYWFVVTRANGKDYTGHFTLKR
ncbi:T9SS type B sorting domain-containing protein [Algibacter sp. L1A34]|uniref:T9SS type B sorting domain-containing protein n=1 Tax=Algibacter sp. L1A34 TaxID=2686365 RepID=UPI00131B526F|nr:T9SS type B sorting domain-containing protein [Algibacter sp. L1A34]